MFTKTKEPMVTKSTGVEVNQVLITDDLSIFKNIDGNRPPNPQHIKRLSKSIEKNGILCNPILVNEKMEVIDGQHRLAAARKVGSGIYYIILQGYKLSEVHTLNLNQKNWSKRDFMEGYADMGVTPYIKLREFVKRNNDFEFGTCISLCQNTSSSTSRTAGMNVARDKNCVQVFEEGTWKGGDFDKAERIAEDLRLVGKYYAGYNRNAFATTMITLMKRSNFDFNEFMRKLRIQPTALVDCAKGSQYKALIEDIYNYRRREKVNLRY